MLQENQVEHFESLSDSFFFFFFHVGKAIYGVKKQTIVIGKFEKFSAGVRNYLPTHCYLFIYLF